MQELMDHLKVHYRPTQSLEGKARTPRVPFFWVGGSRAGLRAEAGPVVVLQEMGVGGAWEVLGTQQWGCPQLGWR